MKLIMTREECNADRKKAGFWNPGIDWVCHCGVNGDVSIPHIHDWPRNSIYCSEGCAIAAEAV